MCLFDVCPSPAPACIWQATVINIDSEQLWGDGLVAALARGYLSFREPLGYGPA